MSLIGHEPPVTSVRSAAVEFNSVWFDAGLCFAAALLPIAPDAQLLDQP
jgi:hypothetical protein